MRQLAFNSPENQKTDSDLSRVAQFAQDTQFDLSTDVLDFTTIDERQIKLQFVSGTMKLVTRYNDTIYTVTLS